LFVSKYSWRFPWTGSLRIGPVDLIVTRPLGRDSVAGPEEPAGAV